MMYLKYIQKDNKNNALLIYWTWQAKVYTLYIMYICMYIASHILRAICIFVYARISELKWLVSIPAPLIHLFLTEIANVKQKRLPVWDLIISSIRWVHCITGPASRTALGSAAPWSWKIWIKPHSGFKVLLVQSFL